MRYFVRFLIIALWVAAVPGCLFVTAPIYKVMNLEPHSRDGAEEIAGKGPDSGFYMMAWLPGGKPDSAHVLLKQSLKGEVEDPQTEGTLYINRAELETINKVLSKSIAERTAQIEILEESEDGQTLKLSVADEGGVGAHIMYVTSWYRVSPDGKSYEFLARKMQHGNVLIPFLLAALISFGLVGLLNKRLKKAYLEKTDGERTNE